MHSSGHNYRKIILQKITFFLFLNGQNYNNFLVWSFIARGETKEMR